MQKPISPSPKSPFLTDIKTIRDRARERIERGAVTEGYDADRRLVLELLNDALSTEIVCVLRYKRHYFMAEGIHSESVAAEFLEHANDEQDHADKIAKRIVQLGGEPQLSPEGMLTRSHTEYVEGTSLSEMIRENLVAERIAIDSYRELVQFIGDRDPTTKRMLEAILADEEAHADDLSSLLKDFRD
ncbi:MAG: bacterioferritin [Alphaproteobacteria bacterium]|nr:bacterioferritin [Alphaproteobacteria bacterium]